MRTNLVQTFKESAKRINLNHIARRVALISLFIILGIGNAWAYSYYSRFTAKSGNTAQGLVYAAGSDSEGSINDYTNQVTPAADDGTSGAEYTWHAWAKAARGYRFKTWTKGSNINSNGTLTEAHCTFGVKHSTSNGGYVDGDATATFESATAYTLTFKQPQNFGGYTAEYANYTISSNKFTPYAKTITMTSATSDKGETSYASDEVTLTATARLGAFLGWYVNGSKVSDNAGGYTFNPSATCNVEGRWEEVQTNIPMHFKAVEKDDNDNYVGSYTVGGQTVQATDYNTTTGANYYLEVTLTATPAAGYVFTGWYTKEGKKKNYISYESPYNAYFDSETTVYANFVYSNYPDDQKAQFKVGSTTYYDLNEANTAAGSSGTIICVRDGILPPGNYTISSGVKLYIPYSTSETYQTTPAVVTTAETLSAYRKLTFAEGANITCNGIICVGGKLMSAGGGKPSSYPTGPCGVIDMSRGGHIELNNKAKLYCWGFIIGQDKDQGDNTNDVGTITVNSGAVVWEGFASGDWRGGTACSTIYSNRSSWKFFPFQSYTIQNIEIPTTYKYGSTLSNYMNVYGGGGTNAGNFNLIGSSETLFLLKDDKSLVRKWYDATTDLVCYEMSGTTLLNELNVDAGITTVSSKDYNLPISTSMHIILTNCSTEITKPMEVQAGAVVEVKSDASLTCSSNVYLFDKDNWGQYCYNKYYYTMTNLTIHKNRGNGTSNAMIDDAKIVVDGTLNVTGKMYSTAGGADIMGNGGGTVTFGSMASGTNMVMCTGVSTNENVAINQANLHNEDSTYTQAASSTFYNVNGRWFISGKQNEKADHTYDFKYISSGAVSGTGGTTTTTDAVYSWDKTGLELRQKWANVDKTGQCPNWWLGTIDGYLYNWTFESAWHQFMPTATEDLYSGSNNKIYTKTGCDWEELGETDENCLYTILGVKKALVDGHFLELVANNNDPAYHLASDASKYYICFAGCNWHEADKYTEAQKAYIIEPDTFIWYDNAWMSVNFQKPFAYTLDETNVPIYYEYLDGEWVLAEPYVRVKDGLENRTYWFLKDAFAFASNVLRTAPTITILRDISGITTAVSYTGTKTCTLDLNGHTITGTVSSMITVNGAGCTFYIVDNTTEKKGKINLVFSANNSRRCALNVKNGHVILNSGTIASTNTMAYSSTNTKPYAEGVNVASGKTFTMNGGRIEVSSASTPYGIEGASGTPTININGGTVETVAETKASPYAIFGYGTINITGGTINAIAKASTSAMGVYVYGSASYQGTANISGGTILARATESAQGVRCWGSATVTADYSAENPDNTPKARYYANLNITGGTIKAECTTSTTSYGVLSYGTTTISGGTITSTVQTSSKSTAYGVCVLGGTTTIQNGANITANAPTKAYGVFCSGANGDSNRGWPHVGVVNITGGTITANTTNTTIAYGLYVTGATWTINKTDGYKVFNGDYASAGTATVTGGTFTANAKTTEAGGIKVDNTVVKNEASATPVCTINGGYYKATGTGTLVGCNAAALPANFHINGGYYSQDM